MNDTILEVKDLSVTFTQYERGFSRRTIHAVEKMDLEIKSGEIVAVVGSSGSGKSLLAHAIMGILPYNSEMDGEIWFLGELLTADRVKKIRGHEIVLVPQSVSYLDPLMKIGDQIQNGKKDSSVKEKCLAVLKRYGLSPDIREKYPFQLSGGMTRRVLISTAVMEKSLLSKSGAKNESSLISRDHSGVVTYPLPRVKQYITTLSAYFFGLTVCPFFKKHL